jgi:uncharacterized protein (TIGR03083 family)
VAGVETLAGECLVLTEQLRRCEEADFARPTRLPAWTVKDVVAHLTRGIGRVRWALSRLAPARADTDAVTYWRRYVPAIAAPDIADRAIAIAEGFSTGAALVDDFETTWRESTQLAVAVPPDRVVGTWGPTLRLDDYLATRLLEVSVHGLDLAAALDRPPWLTPEGAQVTRWILSELLGTDPPATQAMDDIGFIEAGTGRRPLTRAERISLGLLADRFPLLA